MSYWKICQKIGRPGLFGPGLCTLAGVLVFLGVLGPVPAAGAVQETTPLAVARQLQDEYDKTETLAADFTQVTTMEMTGRTRRASGTVIFKKPGRIRWDYVNPDRQVLVSDGTIFQMYFESAKQVIRSPVQEALQSDVTFAFFVGTGNLVRDFEPDWPEAGIEIPPSQYGLRMRPREPHPQLDRLYLWVSKKDFLIEHLRIVDHFGSVTDIFFHNIVRNQELGDDRFAFAPPPGVEVIDR